MAYDDVLAERIRELLIEEPGVTERKMFGGMAFLVDGRLAIAASREGGVLVRVDPLQSDALSARAGVRQAVMKGRPLEGWLRVEIHHLRTKRQLAAWVARSAAFAHSMPPAERKQRRR